MASGGSRQNAKKLPTKNHENLLIEPNLRTLPAILSPLHRRTEVKNYNPVWTQKIKEP